MYSIDHTKTRFSISFDDGENGWNTITAPFDPIIIKKNLINEAEEFVDSFKNDDEERYNDLNAELNDILKSENDEEIYRKLIDFLDNEAESGTEEGIVIDVLKRAKDKKTASRCISEIRRCIQ